MPYVVTGLESLLVVFVGRSSHQPESSRESVRDDTSIGGISSARQPFVSEYS